MSWSALPCLSLFRMVAGDLVREFSCLAAWVRVGVPICRLVLLPALASAAAPPSTASFSKDVRDYSENPLLSYARSSRVGGERRGLAAFGEGCAHDGDRFPSGRRLANGRAHSHPLSRRSVDERRLV